MTTIPRPVHNRCRRPTAPHCDGRVCGWHTCAACKVVIDLHGGSIPARKAG